MPPSRTLARYLALTALAACRPEVGATDAGAPSATAAPSAAPSALGEPRGPRVLLYDSTVTAPQGGVRTRFDAPEGPRVFSPLFPRYLAADTLCTGRTMTPAEARTLGQFAPALLAEAGGAFTRPKALQTLEIIARNECGSTASDPTASKVAAIFEGRKVVAQVDFPSDAALAAVFDANDDGRLELLLAYAWEREGARGTDLKTARVDSGGVVVLRELGELDRDACHATAGPKVHSAGRLVAVRPAGKPAELVIEREPKPCR